LKVGDEVEAQILTLGPRRTQNVIGYQTIQTDPWENIDTNIRVGTKHKAKVRNFTNFGVFVEIEEGVDGLIHISDLKLDQKNQTSI
jgi:small subunit ribosomal protein S1